MIHRRRGIQRVVALALAVLAAGVLAGCGSESASGISGDAIKPIGVEIPAKLLDLDVVEEDVANTLAQAENTYVERVSLYSLRDTNLAIGTLQISALSDEFRVGRARDRAALADKIGGARAQRFRLGSDTVYLTQGQRQRIAVWFRGSNLFVLSSREDYARPRSLLRAALEVTV